MGQAVRRSRSQTCSLLCRLKLPLCFNFLCLADLANRDASTSIISFSRAFGNMKIWQYLLGDWFHRFIRACVRVRVRVHPFMCVHPFCFCVQVLFTLAAVSLPLCGWVGGNALFRDVPFWLCARMAIVSSRERGEYLHS